jgi:hypothetical protein
MGGEEGIKNHKKFLD